MTKYPRYQDYVIRDGRFVGEFEGMYQDFDDPWGQTKSEPWATDKAIGLSLISRLKSEFGVRRVVDLGCGLGGYTRRIRALGVTAIGLDVSPTAIAKAKAEDPCGEYAVGGVDDHRLLGGLAPDLIVMAEVTWYVLPKLRPFLDFCRSSLPGAWLLHTLTLYPEGQQQYGRDFFTTESDIRRFFGMHYLEWGQVSLARGIHRSFFVGTWDADRARAPADE